LTNVLKHANARCVRVALAFHRHQLELDVTDDGSGTTRTGLATIGSGHGLIGMRERVELYGGEIETGPREGGGFRVRARLPLEAE
jgi:signal transduction histidine kinase